MSPDYRGDFPILNQSVNGKSLVYLDNAATTQKPLPVIRAVEDYYRSFNANPHRGAYYLSVKATELYESCRETVRNFIGVDGSGEIVFTKNATEAFNLLAYSYGMNFIRPGDEIVISIAEHHSNLVPWQYVAKVRGAVLRYMYTNAEGVVPPEEFSQKIGPKTKIVAVTHVSNVLGTINPVKEMTAFAHRWGAVVIIDATQSVPHLKINVREIDGDFLVFSGHKMLAPMGIGVLYGKQALLEQMPPFLYGGDMIEYVSEQEATFAPPPQKFEGGTQNVGGAAGLQAAIGYLETIGLDQIQRLEHELVRETFVQLSQIPYVTVYGTRDMAQKAGVISFNLQDIHPHDVSSILDADGIAIRAGFHCAHPLMKYLGVSATCRISFYFYNTFEDIDRFTASLKGVRKWLGYGS